MVVVLVFKCVERRVRLVRRLLWERGGLVIERIGVFLLFLDHSPGLGVVLRLLVMDLAKR